MDQTFKDLLKQVSNFLFCPVCGRSYDIEEIQLSGESGGKLVFKTVCKNNHSPVLTIFLSSGQFERNLITKKKETISLNDVIDFHQKIEKFHGDFKNLWQSRSS